MPGRRSKSATTLRLSLASPTRFPSGTVGAIKNRWRHTACPYATRLAHFLPRRLRIKQSTLHARRLRYSAGVLLLSEKHPRFIRYRSTSPVLEPELPEERTGTVANVVFPTGVDQRTDLGQPNRIDVYYGMADSRIGVARTNVPEELPPKRGQLSARLEHAFDLKVMRRASASS